jgi:sortase B
MKRKAEEIGIKAVRLANMAVNTAVLIVILLLLFSGAYALWDAEQLYSDADSKQYEIYKPSDKEGSKSFEELRAINPDVFAWLTVYGTHIDYPVTQGTDNMQYVNTDPEGNSSLSGAIFMASGSSSDFTDFSSILYGHHMEKEAMFGEIGLFEDKGYFDEREYGSLYFDGKEHGLEFFAFLSADAYDAQVFRTGIRDNEEGKAYLDMLLSRAINTRDIGVSESDRIVLLATCGTGATNERDILVGRITYEIYPDKFAKAEGKRLPVADRLIGLWESLPIWARIAVIAGIAVLATLILIILCKKRRRKKDENKREEDNAKDIDDRERGSA